MHLRKPRNSVRHSTVDFLRTFCQLSARNIQANQSDALALRLEIIDQNNNLVQLRNVQQFMLKKPNTVQATSNLQIKHEIGIG
jgi:hypothetical protein